MSTSNDNASRPAGSTARKLRFGTFEVDLQERELRNRGIRLRLQHKPFQILELLLERRGALVTRTELARHLWPNLHVSFDHGLNTAVNTLRETLGDCTRSPRFIETRSGLGYRFLAPVEEIGESSPGQNPGSGQNDATRGAKHYAPSFEAYQDYLRGKFFFSRMNEADLRKSVACFGSAIEQDSQYALAHSGLADVYSLFARMGMLPAGDACRRAREFATTAIQMDDRLPEAHASLADVKKLFDWDYAGAEAGYIRALELDQNYADGHRRYAALLAATGRPAQALREIRRAMELDPLSLLTNVELAWNYYVGRDFDAAMRQSWKTLVLAPTFSPAQNTLGLAYEQLSMYEEAITELQNACVCSDRHPAAIAALGHANASAGRHNEAAEAVGELDQLSQSRYVSSYWRSIVCLGLGQIDAALDWLEKACEEHDVWLVWLKVEPRFDPLRSQSRFTRALAELGLQSRLQANGL